MVLKSFKTPVFSCCDKRTGLLNVRFSGRRNGTKGRQIAIVVQQGVQLEAALGAAEGSPRG